MKISANNYALILCLILAGCATTKAKQSTDSILKASDLKPYGRYVLNSAENLELISSAVHIGFTFEGRECRVNASLLNKGAHNYLQYTLDGQYQKRIKVAGASNEPIIINAPKEGRHTVWLYKATEAHTGAIIIKNISGKNLKPLQKPDAPLIEFIGNSITCGAAADPSEVPCGTGQYHDQHNAFYAYGPRVARDLNTNFVLSSVSGIGVYRNWNSDGPVMQQVFEKADFQDNNPLEWNFKKYSPNVVSIALGTNDFSRGDGIRKRLPFDSAAFVDGYIKFVRLVKSKYPSSRIALLSSPMAGGNDRLLLQNCISTVKQKIDALYSSDKRVALYFFKPMKARGCTGHPSVEDHAILADELVPFFKKLL